MKDILFIRTSFYIIMFISENVHAPKSNATIADDPESK